MKLSVNIKEFAAELAAVGGCIQTRGVTPVSGMVHIMANERSGSVIITATNLDFGIRCKIDAYVERDGVYLFDYKRLNGWVSVLNGDGKLSISTIGTRTTFSCNGSRFSIAQQDPANYPPFPSMGKFVCKIAPDDLNSLLRGVTPVISEYVNSGVSYSGMEMAFNETGIITAVATDGRRLAYSEISANGDIENPCTTIVSKESIARLLSAAKNKEVQVTLGEAGLFFVFDDSIMYCRRLTNPLQNWRRIMPDPANQTIVTMDSDSAKVAVERVAAMLYGEDSSAVLLEFKDGKMAIFSKAQVGDCEDFVECSYDGEYVSIGVNSHWLKQALDAIEDKADIAIGDKSVLEVRPHGSMKFRTVIAKMYAPER